VVDVVVDVVGGLRFGTEEEEGVLVLVVLVVVEVGLRGETAGAVAHLGAERG
jgi:hypothetical protein